MDRAIVLPEGVNVSVIVNTSHEAVLSVDGHTPVIVVDGDRVESTASNYRLQMVRMKDPGYFYRNLTLYMEHNPVPEITNDHFAAHNFTLCNHPIERHFYAVIDAINQSVWMFC